MVSRVAAVSQQYGEGREVCRQWTDLIASERFRAGVECGFMGILSVGVTDETEPGRGTPATGRCRERTGGGPAGAVKSFYVSQPRAGSTD